MGIALAAALAIALQAFARRRPEPDPAVLRSAELAQLRFVAGRLTEYAREYHRPAFYLDSVTAHLDSADAAEFRGYLVDLWGDSISYRWDYWTFRLTSDAGTTNSGWWAAYDSAWSATGHTAPEGFGNPDSFAILQELRRTLHVGEEYWWPDSARGRTRSGR